MTDFVDIVARAAANQRRRVVPIRGARALSPDPRLAFGFAPIKLVSEEIVQSLAFGVLGTEPEVITRWNPLSRDAGDLERFAAVLDGYLETARSEGFLPRIWVPHTGALKLLELLGHRYRTNKEATESLRRMGAQCRVLAEEARVPGQQVVAVGTNVLIEHAVTGQSPVEDHHLGALLAWHEADDTYDPEHEAERQALLPAAAMLPRPDDDRIEMLRPIAKKKGSRADAARREIETILAGGARREWDMLTRARDAFDRLGLPSLPDAGALVDVSLRRMDWALEVLPNPGSRPAALGRLLEDHEYCAGLLQDALVTGDPVVRERERRAGRVVRADVARIDQPRPSKHPCTITLVTAQPVLRVRRGTQLRTADRRAEGRVTSVERDTTSGQQVIELRLNRGVRKSVRPILGTSEDWLDSVPFDGRRLRNTAYRAAQDSGAFTLTGDPLPIGRPAEIDARDLRRVAEELRST